MKDNDGNAVSSRVEGVIEEYYSTFSRNLDSDPYKFNAPTGCAKAVALKAMGFYRKGCDFTLVYGEYGYIESYG